MQLAAPSVETFASAVDFVYAEAEVLDDRDYETWLGLFATDCRYWVPYSWHDERPDDTINIIFDDHTRLSDRVSRLVGGDVHAQDPPSHASRLIAGPRVVTAQAWNPPGDVDVILQSSFAIYESRRERIYQHAGRATHWLRQAESSWEIAGKKVRLLGSESPLGNLTLML